MSAAAKHTPGPWVAVDGKYCAAGIAHMEDGNFRKPYSVANIIADNGGCGGQCVAVVNGLSTGQVDATARLIAAAPELLAELADIVPRFRACIIHAGSNPEYADAAVAAARAAIAKATGVA